MRFFRMFLNPWDRSPPQRFAAAISAAYVVGMAAQFLTVSPVLLAAGLWPFIAAQAVLTWIWFALHAQRLRDGGRTIAAAQGTAAVHALAVTLLILVGAFFFDRADGIEPSTPASFILVRRLFAEFRFSDPLIILGVLACASLLIAPIFSLWAWAQPSRQAAP